MNKGMMGSKDGRAEFVRPNNCKNCKTCICKMAQYVKPKQDDQKGKG